MRSFETLNPPRIANNGCLIIYEDCRYDGKIRKVESFGYICSRDVRMIAERTLAGVPYYLASLVSVVDKSHIAFIHANAEKLSWGYSRVLDKGYDCG